MHRKLLHLALSLLLFLGPLLPALLTPFLLPASVTAMSLAEPLVRLAPDLGATSGRPGPNGEETQKVEKGGERGAAPPGSGAEAEDPTPGAGDPIPGAGDPVADPGAPEAGARSLPPAHAGAPLWVEVDLAQQRVRVWKEGALLREMVASTGLPASPTPTGVFRLENRGRFFFSKKYGQGGWWWVSFLNRGEYLFHSVPTDEKGRIIPEEAEKLGQPASHGCVRLSLEDAKWFYDQMPEGTPVVIR